jgi:hypothetical protein
LLALQHLEGSILVYCQSRVTKCHNLTLSSHHIISALVLSSQIHTCSCSYVLLTRRITSGAQIARSVPRGVALPQDR